MPARWKMIGAAAVVMLAGTALGDDSAARRALRAGHGLLQRGMIQMALPEYEAALAGSLESGQADEARYGMSVCLTRLARWDEALAALEAISGGDGFAFAQDALMLRGQCLMMLERFADAAGVLARVDAEDAGGRRRVAAWSMHVECLYRAGEVERAIRAWRDGAGAWRDTTEGRRSAFFAARGLHESGRVDEAADLLREVGDDLRAETLGDHRALLLGRCLADLGRGDEALAAFDRAAAAPESRVAGDALLARARVLESMGRRNASVESLEDLLERFPESGAAVLGELDLASHRLDRGEIDAARRLIAHAMAAGGSAVRRDAELLSARCDSAEGDDAGAARRLRGVVESEANPARRAALTYEMGMALRRGGDLTAARRAFGDVLASDAAEGLRADALVALISMAQEGGDDKEAAALCARFGESFDGDARLGRCMVIGGAALERLGDTAGAEAMYRQAAATEGDARGDGVTRLGLLLRNAGREDEASAMLRESAAELGGRDGAPGLLALGDMAYARGDMDEAEACLSRYVELMGDDASCAGAALTLGLIAAKSGDHERACGWFRRVGERWPGSGLNGHARLELGLSLLALGREDDARGALIEASGCDDDRVAVAALRRLGGLASARGAHGEAAEMFGDAASRGGGAGALDSRLRMAQSYADAGMNDEADRSFTALIEEDGGAVGAEALARRGLLRIASGLEEEGMQDVDAALERVPHGSLRGALLLARAGRMGEEDAEVARRLLEEVMDLSADVLQRASSHYELARLDARSGEHERARAHLQEASRLLDGAAAPDRSLESGVLYLSASTALALEMHDEAARLGGEYVQRFPDGALVCDAALVGGEGARRLRRWDESARLFDLAAASGDKEITGSALLRKGDTLGEAGRWGESDAAYAAFLERHSGDARWFRAAFGRGWCAENSGDPRGAMAWYGRVVDGHEGETAARAQFQIGECLYALGEHEEAVRAFMKVDLLHAYPEWSAGALYEAGRCLEQSGDREQARARFAEVVERFGGSEWARMARRALKSAEEASGE
ncbi:MAG: tetratricopeptide repeat protein [Phycisphaeraceae bacterium]|nr:tetratricopeptide repeat protein [Phycisphaeraceae bacterium]